MKQVFIIIICFSFLNDIAAQDQSRVVRGSDPLERLKEKEMDGRVTISMDSLVEENYHKHLLQNSKERGVKGWRIRIFSDNGFGAKDEQRRVRAKFISLFPEIKTYYRYEGSYYKIYVGDYRTRRDALLELEQVSGEFPDAFIVEDFIVVKE